MDAVAALRRVMARRDLAPEEMETLIGRLMDGELSAPLQAALLAALATKGETVGELAGAATAMRRRARRVDHHRREVVDTCGTGGDGKGTFNISTAAALAAAAAGVPVAKHGNRSVSSRSGSADVLEALGVTVEQGPERAAAALDQIGIAFLFAPGYHPAMRRVMPVRQALGVRTMFNVLGPLTNPAGAGRQLLGVYAPQLVETLAGVLRELGSRRALVVHGEDGLDEITTTGATRVAELRDGRITTYTLTPEQVGIERVPAAALAGGTPDDNAAALERVLAGERGALFDVTALNAGAAILVAGLADDLATAVESARLALVSGAARDKLDQLRRFSAGAR